MKHLIERLLVLGQVNGVCSDNMENLIYDDDEDEFFFFDSVDH